MKTFQERLAIFESFIEERTKSSSVAFYIKLYKDVKNRYTKQLQEIRTSTGKSKDSGGWSEVNANIPDMREAAAILKKRMKDIKNKLKNYGITKIPI